MDQHLKKSFAVPQTPATKLNLNSADGVPTFQVTPDASRPVESVDVFFTQHGKPNEQPQDMQNTMTRFWHHATVNRKGETWTAQLPLHDVDRPLWVFANVSYRLDEPVSGAGYYYGEYTADSFNVSSLLTTASAVQLQAAETKPTAGTSAVIEDFSGDWKTDWFSYRPGWATMTHKLRAKRFAAPTGALMELKVQSADPNTLVVLLDDYAATVSLLGGDDAQTLRLAPSDFRNFDGEALSSWQDVRRLKLTDAEHLRPKRGSALKPRVIGKRWTGSPPKFHELRWHTPEPK